MKEDTSPRLEFSERISPETAFSPPANASSRCVVVGVGASAGGLQAFKHLLEVTPQDTGLAFVLIQHLDPDHRSVMADLLSRHTSMTVREAGDGMSVEPNHVYIIPPKRFLRLQGDRLVLESAEQGQRIWMPINYFFHSLATERRERAIAIVLTGTGSDGTQGAKAIKSNGGMVLAQTPESAAHDGMPQSLIDSGAADLCCEIEAMPEKLVRYAQHPYVRFGRTPPSLLASNPTSLREIIDLLNQHAEYDFSSYKKGTLSRRIRRRMGLRHVSSIGEYAKLLQRDDDEIRSLFDDMLIGVTAFFREPDAWRRLTSDVVAKVVARKRDGESVRIWVPGCSTGEEAYSVAMVFDEQMRQQRKELSLKLFATDLDPNALQIARRGFYPARIESEISPERLIYYFSEKPGGYRILKRLRESCVFAVQNLLADPPFSKLDFISCRNVLIYLEPEVQKRLIETFEFSLAPSGYLFLGGSETVGRSNRTFEFVSRTHRIYQKLATSSRPGARLQMSSYRESSTLNTNASQNEGASNTEIARKALLERFAPASAMINAQGEVKYAHGPIRDYLQLPTGEPVLEIHSMCVEGLRATLHAAIQQAKRTGQPARGLAQGVPLGDRTVAVSIEVAPITDSPAKETLLLVSFGKVPSSDKEASTAADGETNEAGATIEQSGNEAPRLDSPSDWQTFEAGNQRLIEELERELVSTRDDLQSTIEELETSNEELKASNEEVRSTNEELQSANEELENSSEELQSLNAELCAVNRRLEDNLEELKQTSNDVTNLLTSSEIATIFLDRDLNVRRFTPAAEELFAISQSDVGRGIKELVARLKDPDLASDAVTALTKLVIRESEVELNVRKPVGVEESNALEDSEGGQTTSGDRWFVRRVLPYRSSDDRIEGVVITFADVTRLKRSAEKIRRRERQSAMVATIGHAALAGTDLDSLFDRAMVTIADSLEVELCKLLELQPNGEELRLRAGVGWKNGLVGKGTVGAGLQSQAGFTLQSSSPIVVEDLTRERRFSGPPLLHDHGVISGVSVVVGPPDRPWGVLGAHCTHRRRFSVEDTHFMRAIANVLWDAIERRRVEEELNLQLIEINSVYENAPVGLCFINTEYRYIRINKRLAAINGRRPEDHLGKTIPEVLPELAEVIMPNYRQVMETGEPIVNLEISGTTPAEPEVQRDWLVSYFALKDGDTVLGVNSVVLEITEQRARAKELEAARNHVSDILSSISDGFIALDSEGRCTYINQSAQNFLQYSQQQITGKLFWETFSETIDTPFYRSVKQAMAENRVTEIEWYYERAERWYHFRNYPAAAGVAIYFTDVTEVRRAQEELRRSEELVRQSEERLRLAAEAAQVGTFDANLKTGEHYWSPDMKKILVIPEDAQPKVMHIIPDFVHPKDRKRVSTAIKQSLDVNGSGRIQDEHRIVRGDGETRWVNLRARTQFEGEGKQRRAVRSTGTMVDITPRKTAEIKLKELNETLEERIRERAGLITLLHDITVSCHHASTTDEAVSFVLREFSRYNGWCFGHAFRRSEADSDQFVTFMDYYATDPDRFRTFREATRDWRIRTGDGLPGRVIETRKPQFVRDLKTDPISVPYRKNLTTVGVKSAVAFPVTVGNQVVAVLEFFSDERQRMDDRLMQAMASIGSQLGRVVERVRLQREIAELAAEERQRIGSDLHDTVIQQLTGSEMLAESLRQKMNDSPDEPAAANLVQTLKDAQTQIRRLHRGLMPVEVDPEGLRAALETLALNTAQMHNVQCEFECENEVAVPDSITATYLYRIAQEAVHNAIKHSNPNCIKIRLHEAARIYLVVVDDGCGFNENTDRVAGSGIRIMRYRAGVIGGRLEVRSRAGHGTMVSCSLINQIQ